MRHRSIYKRRVREDGLMLMLALGMLSCKKQVAAPVPAGPVSCASFESRLGKLEGQGTTCTGVAVAKTPELPYWIGDFEYVKTINSTNLEISAKFKRPYVASFYPVEIVFMGGHFGASKAGYFFWESDLHYSETKPAPTFLPNDENELKVRQTGKKIEGFVNGTLVGSFELEKEPAGQRVGVFFKAKKDVQSQVQVRDFTVREL